MTAHRALNWTIAGLIALLLSCSYLLDGPDDNHAEHAQALSLQDAIKSEAADARFARAAADICGENAGFSRIDASTIQCYTHKGKPTRRVSL